MYFIKFIIGAWIALHAFILIGVVFGFTDSSSEDMLSKGIRAEAQFIKNIFR